MSEELGLFEAISTQRAIRRFRPDPVSDEVILKLLEAAAKAPSGSNRQNWHFVVIRDPELKQQIAALYGEAWHTYDGMQGTAGVSASRARIRASAMHLADHMGETPVLILACIENPHPRPTGMALATRYASIYPAVQNLLLAARALGLGAALTTLHKAYEEEVKALLGLPEDIETAALIPLGYPADRYGPTRRKPVHQFTHFDRWGNMREPKEG